MNEIGILKILKIVIIQTLIMYLLSKIFRKDLFSYITNISLVSSLMTTPNKQTKFKVKGYKISYGFI